MAHERLRFALDQLSGGDWLAFERFSSEFLVEEFPDLRTTASPSGDRGRDGEVFAVPGVAATGFQYSVAEDWKAKIRKTVKTIQENELGFARLVYCTPREVGALGDDLKSELWTDHQILLDVRDREWFCERELTTAQRATAAAELAQRIVDPIVTSRQIATSVGTPLSDDENRVALVQLALNANDSAEDRSLTKTSFDALVKAALIDTSAEAMLREDEVIANVQKVVPHGAKDQVSELTRSALARLSRKGGPVKFHSGHRSYHLSFQEAEAWKTAAVGYLLNQDALENDLVEAARGRSTALDGDAEQLAQEGKNLRAALEAVMLRSGEAFAAAIEGGEPRYLSRTAIAEQLSELDLGLRLEPEDAAAAIMEVLANPSDRTHLHLLRVLDAYTLLAFLHQTPDVQKAMSRVFDSARIWLDTSTVLPLLAETLIEDTSRRHQTTLLAAAVSSGVELYVTDGVVEELRFHLERCVAYVNSGKRWQGEAPYIYSAYMLSGRDERQLSSWLSNFRGDINPEQDIEEYLSYHYSITKKDLSNIAEEADPDLRGAVQELFREKHSRRRGRRDENVIDRLADHDVENVVGIIQLRKGRRAALGHDSWWLTLDKSAFKLPTWLRDRLGRNAPDSPVLSPDYLSQLLRLGPLRRTVQNDANDLPLVVDVTRLESIPPELIEEARKTRAAFQGHDELRIQREVRDAVSRLRTTMRTRDYADSIRGGIAQELKRRS